MHDSKARKTLFAGGFLGFLFFLAMGIFVGVMLAPEKGSESRRRFIRSMSEMGSQMKKKNSSIKEHVWEVFGEVNDELEKGYVEAHDHVVAIADILRDEAALTREKYNEIVSDTVKRVAKARDWSRDYANNLIQDLREEWESVK